MNTRSTAEQQRDHITEYLGNDASKGGPFAVLDLRHDQMDEQMILRACKLRLVQISRHIRSRTPEADEARLAVHAAASQLLDPMLREELKKYWPGGSGEILETNQTPEAWRVDEQTQIDPGLLRKARWMLGASGGWNNKSRKRLGYFARAHQVPAARLIGDLLGDQSGSKLNRLDNSSHPRSIFIASSTVPAAFPWLFFPMLYGVMSILLIGAAMYGKAAKPQARIISPELQEHSSNADNAQIATHMRSESRNDLQRQHYTAIIHELEGFAGTPILEEGQAKALSSIGERLCNQWTSFPAEELTRAFEITQEALRGILNEDLFMLASSFLGNSSQGGFESIAESVFKYAFFGGINSNPEFGLTQIDQDIVLRDALSTTLSQAATQSTDDPAWWAWWDQQLQARSVFDWGLRTDPWVSSCRSRLLDSSTDGDWASCARVFVQGVSWGENSGAKVWYMAQVSDRSVHSGRLAELSQAVALYSSAGGMDTQTVIDPDASMDEREAYLGELRSRWGSQTQDPARDALADQLRMFIEISSGSMTETQALSLGIELARVNTACWGRERGDDSMVGVLEQRFNTPVEQPVSSNQSFDPSSNVRDEQWAEAARNTTDPEVLLDLLKDIDRQGSIQPKSAHALALLAMQAPDLGVREFAERVLLSHRDEINVLIALDRVAGGERVSRRMIGLIQSCLNDSSAESNLRRRLLERMLRLGVFTLEAPSHDYSAYSLEYSELLAMRIGREGEALTRDVYVYAIQRHLEDQLDIPERVRSSVRVGLNRSLGRVQQDVIYMNGFLGLLANRLKNQHPGVQQQIDIILDDHSNRMAHAKSVFEQIMLAERAIAQLWVLKLESEMVS